MSSVADIIRSGTLAARPVAPTSAQSRMLYVVTDGPFGNYLTEWNGAAWIIAGPPVGGGVVDAGDGSTFDPSTVVPGQILRFHTTKTPANVAVSEGPTDILWLPIGFCPLTQFFVQHTTTADSGTDSAILIEDNQALADALVSGSFNPADLGPGMGFTRLTILNLTNGPTLTPPSTSPDGIPVPDVVQWTYTVGSTPGLTKPVVSLTIIGTLPGLATS